jgi:cell division protease FtsH
VTNNTTPTPPSKPGGRRPSGRPRGFFKSPFSVLWWVLGAVLLIGVVQAFLLMPASGSISYSEFKRLVRSGQVAEVTIGKDAITGILKSDDPKPKRFSTVPMPVEDRDLLKELDQYNVKAQGEQISRWLPEILGWLLPLAFLLLLWFLVFRRMGGAEGGIMSFARSRAKVYVDDDVKVTFADVAGVEEAANELREIVEFLKTPGKYTNLGGKIPKGVLLVGPPGTGKTLLARAVAGEANVPFFSLSGSEFVEMFVGVGAARVRDLFSQADAKSPCIIFIDELDALGKVRIQSPMGSHEEREQTLNQLLAEMDGFDPRKAIIIMGATNRPEVLDPALMRPGRFDRQVLVDKPDIKGREAIMRIHVRAVKLAPDVDLRVVAARTAGFAGADLANLVNEAALLAARRDKAHVDFRDFNEAIDRLIAGLEKRRVISERERKIVAYHESGHAIVATALPNLDPVHKVSIVQRGFAALGYTMQLPTEDRYLQTRGDLLSQMAVLMAGRTAEEIALGEISTGAQNDLMRATDIARAMVMELGMSDAIGPVNYNGHKQRAMFLDTPGGSERGLHSEQTAQHIDKEVHRLLTEAYDRARNILNEQREVLERVTLHLLNKEVLEQDEFLALYRGEPDTLPVVQPAPTTFNV